jgi:copper resistance protein C
MKTNLLILFLTGVLLQAAASSRAFAHAMPDHADPRVGSTVSSAPGDVTIHFTQEIEPAFSAIQVFDPSGKQIDKKDSHIDSQSRATLVVSVPNLSSGTYKVVWHVVSVDTHKTQGDFKFTVK